jgi:hypothetical protein
MAGETDVAAILRALTVDQRPGAYAYVSVHAPPPELLAVALAMVEEIEGTTLVVPRDAARRAGLTPLFEAAWLTIGVHSSLEAVGLTAAVATRLAEAGIPANVLAGYHHDHVLVPVDRADEAIAALRSPRRA